MKSEMIELLAHGSPSRRDLWLIYYPFTVLLVALSLFAHIQLRDIFSYSIFLFFYPTVFFACFYGGLKPGLLAVSLGTLSSIYLLWLPHHYFGWAELLGVGIFSVFSMAVAISIHRARKLRFELVHSLRAQKNLEDIQTRLALLVEISTEFIAMIDSHGTITYLNRKAKDLLGIDAGASLLQIEEIFLCETATDGVAPLKFKEIEQKIQKQGRFFVKNLSSGLTSPVSLQLRRMSVGKDQDAYSWALIGRDLRSEIETDEKLSAALQLTAISVWEYNFVTRSFKRSENHDALYGMDSHLNLPFEPLFRRITLKDRRQMMRDLHQRLKNKEKLFYWDYEVEWDDGRRVWLSSRGSIFYGFKGRPLKLVGGTVDISKEKITEIELSQAIRLRDEFVSIASHELKTPVTSLLLYLDLLKEELDLKPNQKDFLLQVMGQARKLSNLTDSLLDAARVTAGKIELQRKIVNPKDLIDELVKKFQKLNPEQIYKVDDTHYRKGGRISVDTVRWDQITSNLLSNATKFGNKLPVTIKLSSLEDRILVEFIDNGEGIPKEIQKNIFDRFSPKTSRANKVSTASLGLGLYISKVLTEVQGGELSVSSTPKKGATFSLSFPIHREKEIQEWTLEKEQ